MQIVTNQDTTGQVSLIFTPYLLFTDRGVAIPTNMASVAVPSEDIKQQYSEKFNLICYVAEQEDYCLIYNIVSVDYNS